MHYRFWEEAELEQQETFSHNFEAYREDLAKQGRRTTPPRFGRLAGVVMAAGLAVYGVATYDVPMLCLTAAMLAFGLKEMVAKLFGSAGAAVANAMQGFAVVLGLGSLLLLFL